MALVPLILPPVIKLLTTKKERAIYMKPTLRPVSKLEKILFPLVTTVIVILFVPASAPLIGCLMLGNLFRESGVVERLSSTAQTVFIDVMTIIQTMPSRARWRKLPSGQNAVILVLGCFVCQCSRGRRVLAKTELF
jgi:oxaloacetate decarboxylase beta subunit